LEACVLAVERERLTVTVESAPEVMGCRACGVLGHGHGRVVVSLVDAPAKGRPVRSVWRKRRWVCLEPACPV
jgi:transposase